MKILSYIFLTLSLFFLLTSCEDTDSDTFQGYVEAEYLYVASPLAGRLDKLSVQRGDFVSAGVPLFILEHESEEAAVMEAEARLQAAKFQLDDLKTGKRPLELDVYRGQLKQAAALEELSSQELIRNEKQFKAGGIPKTQLEQAQANFQSSQGKTEELKALLQSGMLPGRQNQQKAQRAEVKAAEAKLKEAKWKLSQKFLKAPKEGLIFDTLYVEGEWVAGGLPIVLLLPPSNMKVRFFVPEPVIGHLGIGQTIEIRTNNPPRIIVGNISYISPQAEYTPPVIFSNETREKLIFMIEASVPKEEAFSLHPGQPVEVHLG